MTDFLSKVATEREPRTISSTDTFTEINGNTVKSSTSRRRRPDQIPKQRDPSASIKSVKGQYFVQNVCFSNSFPKCRSKSTHLLAKQLRIKVRAKRKVEKQKFRTETKMGTLSSGLKLESRPKRPSEPFRSLASQKKRRRDTYIKTGRYKKVPETYTALSVMDKRREQRELISTTFLYDITIFYNFYTLLSFLSRPPKITYMFEYYNFFSQSAAPYSFALMTSYGRLLLL